MSRAGFASSDSETRQRCRECFVGGLPMAGNWTLAMIAVGVALVTALGMATRSQAQSCTSDYECTRSLALGGNARCIGDTLIRTTTRCIGGRCQTRETSRQRCATGNSGRCVAGGYQRTESRCDALNGRCSTRTTREACKRGCSCRNNILIVYTGACSPAIGCHKGVRKCPGGCSCDPEPVCKQ